MRNRAIGAEASTRAAPQLHRAIARKSLCLAGALSRQFDRFTPLRLQLGADNAIAVERLLALYVLRRLPDGGNGLRLLGQCRLQHRARGLQFQHAVAIGWGAVAGPLAFDVAVVALAV